MPLNNTAAVVAANALRGALAFGQLHSGPAGSSGTSNVTTAARLPMTWAAATGAGTFGLLSQVNFTGGASSGTVYSVTLWNGPTALPAPTIGTPTTSTTGGTLPPATYYFKMTATNALGETTASSEVSITTTGSTSTITIPWTPVTYATGYNFYRSTAPGGEVFLTSVAGGSTNTFTFNGSLTPGTATPPASNTTAGTAFYGEFPLTGDSTFNSSGGYSLTALDLNGTES